MASARSAEVERSLLGLRARMLVALLIQSALVLAVLGVLVWPIVTGKWVFTAYVLLMVGGGLAARAEQKRPSRRGPRKPELADRDRVAATATRLAVAGNVEVPEIKVRAGRAPLSWTRVIPGFVTELNVTTGLLDRLDDRELTAVVAHEIGHLVNRDAGVMAVLAGPGAACLGSIRGMADALTKDGDIRAICALAIMVPTLGLAGVLLTVSGRIVSRHREFAADRTAAALTGSPAGLAAALVSVSEGLRAAREQDLRVVASRNPFHFVPTKESRGVRRLWATHPPTAARLRHLDHLEATLGR